jgi:hypothetical protein
VVQSFDDDEVTLIMEVLMDIRGDVVRIRELLEDLGGEETEEND